LNTDKDAKEMVRHIRDNRWSDGGALAEAYWRAGIFRISVGRDPEEEASFGRAWNVLVEWDGEIWFPFTHLDEGRYSFWTRSEAQTAARKFATSLRKALFSELGADSKDIDTPSKRKRITNTMVKVLKG
tara:strand:- start:270 stop:656 length:387 start_codon:yes stop_codon:yes gene_type:complete